MQGGGARAACCALCPLCLCNMSCALYNLSLCIVHRARRNTHTYTCLPRVQGLVCLVRCVLCQWCTLSLCSLVLCTLGCACAHVAASPMHLASPTTAYGGTRGQS